VGVGGAEGDGLRFSVEALQGTQEDPVRGDARGLPAFGPESTAPGQFIGSEQVIPLGGIVGRVFIE
jgi:hypothetical protein